MRKDKEHAIMNSFLRQLVLCIPVASSALCVGCGSTAPSRFYLLDPLGTPGGAAGATNTLSIGVGPINLPPYLARPQIVTRDGGPEIDVAEYDRWAEPLDENVVRVLADNLSRLIGTDHIALFPWRGTLPLDYRIGADVTRFDGELGGDAVLNVRWALRSASETEFLIVKTTTLRESVESEEYDALVGAQSKLLGKWSQEIAAAVQKASSSQ